MTNAPKAALTAEHWAEAALKALGRGGVAAVAVEPLARELGVTKGSFYWHYPNRKALLHAAVALWEARGTEEVITRVVQALTPRRRIERLFSEAFSGELETSIYFGLQEASDDPQVALVLRRVTERRMAFLKQCYLELGLSEPEATRYALLSYSAYLGTLHLRHETPEAFLPVGLQEYVDLVIHTLIPPEAS
jgi:AcrR family transcriptional regulator